VTAVNVFAPDGLVARQQGGAWTQYTFDQQGNVAQRLDAGQNVLSSSIYDAYGMENTTGAASDTFGYNARAGYILDRETGLYLCQHRYYDPAGGRWLNRDPIGFAGGANVYAYCQNRPNLCCDPSGDISLECIIAATEDALKVFLEALGGLSWLCKGWFALAIADCVATPPSCLGALWAAAEGCGEEIVAKLPIALGAMAAEFAIALTACELSHKIVPKPPEDCDPLHKPEYPPKGAPPIPCQDCRWV
jgi:RHS repeat-associated protein